MKQGRRPALSTTVGAMVLIVAILVLGGVVYAGTRSPTPTTTPLSSSTTQNGNPTSSSASCGGSAQITRGAGAGPSGAPGYSPDAITVVIGVNNTVTWTNCDTSSHTVASNSVPSGASSFTSQVIPQGGTYSETFTVPGTYTYYCTLHSWMTGTVIVKSG